ncbi:MAG TPA: hypothetical protein VIV60_03330 [Polyangiaceae bacterium]
MTVENVAREFQGVYCNDQADPKADREDLLTDLVYNLPIVLDAAAGTDYTYASFKAPFRFRVIDATICPGAALTAADATANTITLAKADGAGGSATTIASIVTNVAGGSWVADTFKAMTLSATDANLLVADGQLVTLKKTHASTGTVTPASTLTLRIRKY